MCNDVSHQKDFEAIRISLAKIDGKQDSIIETQNRILKTSEEHSGIIGEHTLKLDRLEISEAKRAEDDERRDKAAEDSRKQLKGLIISVGLLFLATVIDVVRNGLGW